MKADFIMSLMELVVGGTDGLQPIERTVIDRCTRIVYRDVMNDPENAPMPILQDLYDLLNAQPELEAKRLATALEIYCTGSLNVFNHRTTVDTDKRVICIVLNKLGAGLRKIAMHVTNEMTWAVVDENFRNGIFTWCYYDEFHILLRDALTASYFVAIWKMLRKKACVPSALTQNVKDLLTSKEVENILENSEFMVMLSQAAGDREILARQLGISTHQLSYVTHSGSGERVCCKGRLSKPTFITLAAGLFVAESAA
jgi:type IV secretory pathway VirB4 component